MVQALEARADRVHGKGVGGEVHEAGVLWEGEHGAARIETNAGVPAGEVGGRFLEEVIADGPEVEVPFVASVRLDQVVQEHVPPLGTDHRVLQLVVNG